MLNLICSYRRPEKISPVSGIPPDWNRSDYNKPGRALAALTALAEALPAKFLLLSYNSEGFIRRHEMERALKKIGRVEVLETPYSVFKGSRNLKSRGIHVKEYLFVVERR
jgi:adenine-specific DNA-methyltransferase